MHLSPVSAFFSRTSEATGSSGHDLSGGTTLSLLETTVRRTVLFIFGTLLGLVLLAWVLARADLSESLQRLRELDFLLILYPTLIIMVIFAIRSWRWQLIFPVRSRPGYRGTLSAFTIGLFLNNFLPGRGGDLSRCLIVGRASERSGGFSMALATMAVEQLFDVVALLTVVALSFTLFAPPAWLQKLGMAAAVLAAGAVVLVVLLHARSAWTVAKARGLFETLKLPGLGERVAQTLERFAEGLEIVSSVRRLALTGFLTAAIWLLEGTTVVFLSAAAGNHIGMPEAMTLIAMIGLGMFIPSGPGFVGTYEFVVVSGFELFGFSPAAGLAAAVVFHAWVFFVTTVAGLGGLAMRGFGWSDLKRLRRRREQIQSTGRADAVDG